MRKLTCLERRWRTISPIPQLGNLAQNVEIAVAKPVLSYSTTDLTLEHTYVRTRIRMRAPAMELRKFPGQQLLPCPRTYAVNMFGRCTLPRRFAAR